MNYINFTLGSILGFALYVLSHKVKLHTTMSAFIYLSAMQLLRASQTAIVLSTTTDSSFLRYISSCCNIFLCYRQYILAHSISSHPLVRIFIATDSLLHGIHGANLMLLSNINWMKASTSQSTFSDRIRQSFRLVLSPRGIGTKLQIANIPRFSDFGNMLPTRRQFLWSRSRDFVWRYLLLDALSAVAVFYQHSGRGKDYLSFIGPDVHVLHFGMGLKELCVRTVLQILFTLWTKFTLSFLYDSVSLVAVGFSLSAPEDWPPLFGSISEAWTMRRFWG